MSKGPQGTLGMGCLGRAQPRMGSSKVSRGVGFPSRSISLQ